MEEIAYTERVLSAFRYAREAAEKYRNPLARPDEITPEHLLLGLIEVAEGGGGVWFLLDDAGIKTKKRLRSMKRAIKQRLQRRTKTEIEDIEDEETELRNSPKIQQILETAKKYASILGEDEIGTEYILYGVAHVDSVATWVLNDFGVEPGNLEKLLMK